MAIEWSQKLAVGVEAIDAQHRELFKQVNQLIAAMEARHGEAEVTRIVQFLGDYVIRHFGDEERLMARTGYPDAAAHEKLHEAFVADFVKLKAELARTGASPALATQLNQKVGGWLIDHIGRTDRALGAFLAGKAAATAPRAG
ncbi:MAG TPA: hemerythrin family protein [Anaeromyxobacteraceae bacterium]|nr:hemerythrin family protein [Anaeromyxobacteraceae bacterium]